MDKTTERQTVNVPDNKQLSHSDSEYQRKVSPCGQIHVCFSFELCKIDVPTICQVINNYIKIKDLQHSII